MLKTFTKGGIHPPERKLSDDKAIITLPPPAIATLPLSQHLGVPAVPAVTKGETVKTGQLIARGDGFVSANIYASVSGIVTKIDNLPDQSGYKKPAIVIERHEDVWIESIDRTSSLVNETTEHDGAEILKLVQEAGIVGLGGATFPSHVKLTVPRGKTVSTLLINGVECEPYLTADNALMMERSEAIIAGVLLLIKALAIEKAFIGIENNKPAAILKMQEAAAKHPHIQVIPLQVKYPQGGEKMLIKAVLGLEVPIGGLPVDVGAVVFNVGTAFAVYEAVLKRKPLFERVVTVTGKSLASPSNFLVRIGTPISMLIEAAGGMPADTGKVVVGGPMMGKALTELNAPVIKGTSGVLVLPRGESVRGLIEPCIRCARCVSVCPMGLEPYLLQPLAERASFERLETARVLNCIECGSCSYICPANRPLLDYIRLGKAGVNKLIRSRK